MNDIDKIPVKCRDCPYWELASYPWCCGDCKDIMNPKNGEYIKRSDLIEHFSNYNPNWGVIDKDTVLDDIRDFPAADVELVRHGRWIEYKHEGQMAQYCSECGSDPGVIYIYERCPECGAHMNAKRGREDNDDKS